MRLFSVMAVLATSFSALAGSDNFGWYEKIGEEGDYGIYQLVWSTHIPDIESVPLQDGEFLVSPGGTVGDGCDSGPLPGEGLCPAGSGEALVLGRGSLLSSDDDNSEEIPDRIVVEGERPPNLTARAIRWDQGGGSDDGNLIPVGFVGSLPGASPESALPTNGEASECSAEPIDREVQASLQIKATMGIAGCMRNDHRGVYWEVNFPGGATGVYIGSDSVCPGSHLAHEVVPPDC